MSFVDLAEDIESLFAEVQSRADATWFAQDLATDNETARELRRTIYVRTYKGPRPADPYVVACPYGAQRKLGIHVPPLQIDRRACGRCGGVVEHRLGLVRPIHLGRCKGGKL